MISAGHPRAEKLEPPLGFSDGVDCLFLKMLYINYSLQTMTPTRWGTCSQCKGDGRSAQA